MRYRVVILPFMDDVHITVTRWDSQLGTVGQESSSYVMTPEEGEPEHLYSVLAWLAQEVASQQG